MAEGWLIAALATGIYGLRVSGMLIPEGWIPDRWSGAFRHLPVALLTALVVTSRSGLASGQFDRIAAIAVALLMAWRYRKVWAVILSGMTVFLAIRAI